MNVYGLHLSILYNYQLCSWINTKSIINKKTTFLEWIHGIITNHYIANLDATFTEFCSNFSVHFLHVQCGYPYQILHNLSAYYWVHVYDIKVRLTCLIHYDVLIITTFVLMGNSICISIKVKMTKQS